MFLGVGTYTYQHYLCADICKLDCEREVQTWNIMMCRKRNARYRAVRTNIADDSWRKCASNLAIRRPYPSLQMFPTRNRFGTFVPLSPQNLQKLGICTAAAAIPSILLDRRQHDMAVGLYKDGYTQPRNILTHGPGEGDPVHRRPQPPCGPKFEGVAYVDDDGVRDAGDVSPRRSVVSSSSQDLKPALVRGLAEKQGK